MFFSTGAGGGPMNWRWPPHPHIWQIFAAQSIDQKSLRKTANMGHTLAPASNCWKTGLRPKDVIQLGAGNTGLRIWLGRNWAHMAIIHFSTLTSIQMVLILSLERCVLLCTIRVGFIAYINNVIGDRGASRLDTLQVVIQHVYITFATFIKDLLQFLNV